MILTRRRLILAGAATLALGGGGYGLARHFRRRGGNPARVVTVRARPIPSFLPSDPERRAFGALSFRTGLVLSSDDPGFGGWSGLSCATDGSRLVAISDQGDWLTARIDREEGRATGLSDAAIAPILDASGAPLGKGPSFDTEGLAIADGTAWVSCERTHELRRFAFGREGVAARGQSVALPPEVKTLPDNRSLEAVAVAPPGHQLAGRVVLVAEQARSGEAAPTRGWVVTGPEPFAFDLARSEDFDITDIAFLPGGDLLVLERRFFPLTGVACRIRRIARDAIRPGALLDGPVLFFADRSYEIDNMEGLGLHQDPSTGRTIVTLISDDNFQHLIQRTLLLEFELRD